MEQYESKFLESFSLQTISTLKMLATEMELYGLTAKEVSGLCDLAFEDAFKETESSSKAHNQPTKKLEVICPFCGKALNLYEVNKSKCTQVGGGWKTSLECSSTDCLYTRMSKRSPMELRKDAI